MTRKTEEKQAENPKVDPTDESNRIKDPNEWTTGGEPMTGAQASYLKTLSEQAKSPEAFDPDLDKAEASKRIDALRQETGKAYGRASDAPLIQGRRQTGASHPTPSS